MKRLSLILVVAAFTGVVSAESIVGNGGDVVVCQTIHITLFDIYEGMQLRGNTYKSVIANRYSEDDVTSDNLDLFRRRLSAWRSPTQELILRYIDSFEANVRFLPSANLTDVPDTDSDILPKGCELRQVAVQKPVEFPGDKFYRVDGQLWQYMSGFQRAALITHEALYRVAVEKFGAKNSRAIRFLNAWLWSDAADTYYRLAAGVGSLTGLVQALNVNGFLTAKQGAEQGFRWVGDEGHQSKDGYEMSFVLDPKQPSKAHHEVNVTSATLNLGGTVFTHGLATWTFGGQAKYSVNQNHLHFIHTSRLKIGDFQVELQEPFDMRTQGPLPAKSFSIQDYVFTKGVSLARFGGDFEKYTILSTGETVVARRTRNGRTQELKICDGFVWPKIDEYGYPDDRSFIIPNAKFSPGTGEGSFEAFAAKVFCPK